MHRYLSLGEFAQRCGYTLNTMKGYRRKRMLPEPDARIGRNHGWDASTVDQWRATRKDPQAEG
ncbi:XRE family transcriptional regulator [Allobranchiibius sp. CTAmp26]|uniref:XRE family transcriptional regulator n=1 Tax=Allobranchiibius sp. CTAmp26 TaxID=2815214 RepID=UPI001AA0B835|nr:XRE family transcriptional regulator [Allobranchiibius sp. CTAmp26]MBO1756865.1 XRE family transcriptional regulator [Allobranchiibius sp. CTAmp26]